jgi:hypothetical protein
MEITFKSTGKKFKTSSDQISFNESDGLVYSGYDNVEFAENEDGSYECVLTQEEKAELAQIMIDKWKQFGGLE